MRSSFKYGFVKPELVEMSSSEAALSMEVLLVLAFFPALLALTPNSVSFYLNMLVNKGCRCGVDGGWLRRGGDGSKKTYPARAPIFDLVLQQSLSLPARKTLPS